MGTSTEVIDSLNVDLAKEHGAIVQYLLHMGQVRGSGLRWSYSNAAREEMWHMEWLIEAIRERGGEPTLERDEEIVNVDDLAVNVAADMHAEDDALAHYEVTLAAIGDTDEELTALIERIMDDERYHRTTFGRMGEVLAADGQDGFRAKPELSGPDAGAAAPMFGLEYEGLLQYLWNKYGSGEGEEAERYFELAINEMRHFNYVGSCYGGLPAAPAPPVPKERIVQVDDPAAAHKVAEAYEAKAADVIAQVSQNLSGQQIASELQRIGYQHGYHRFLLDHM